MSPLTGSGIVNMFPFRITGKIVSNKIERIMNQELITLNEVLTDGSTLFIYREDQTGNWVSYGYSAYLLSLMFGRNNLSGFSDTMQMPFVSITDSDFRKVFNDRPDLVGPDSDNYRFSTTVSVDSESYRRWVDGLK